MTVQASYDVVIAGGGIYGAAVSWWLTRIPEFQGRIAVIERDPSYASAATSHTNSCIRQQFTTPVNIAISQFGADFIYNFRDFAGDPEAPTIRLQSFGYLYLAADPDFAASLRAAQQIQARHGAGTLHLNRSEIAARYPFFHLDDIVAGNHNRRDEGYFDGAGIFDWFRRAGRKSGITYIEDEVVGLDVATGRVTAVTLKSGAKLACGIVVNAAGTRAPALARMAGLDLPIEPRKRYSYVFEAERPLDRDLPLTIDPSGVHMRSEGPYYLAGGPPDNDPAVAPDDFTADHSLWEEKFWPAIAHRIPQFEAIRVKTMWVGHYDYNTRDQNALLGPHPDLPNFLFCNGFSGHGLQQAPAIGRGLAELIAFGEYRSLDLSPLSVTRLAHGTAFAEQAVI